MAVGSPGVGAGTWYKSVHIKVVLKIKAVGLVRSINQCLVEGTRSRGPRLVTCLRVCYMLQRGAWC